MARPVKLGLDYFPTDTDILKLQLLTDIYRNSYFIELSDEYIFDLADQFHKRDKTILEMIDFMVEVDLFNKNLRNSLILTSPSIQKRYFTVKGNSYKGLEKDLLYILIPLSTEKTLVISEETPQRKGKKSKVKESRENESINNHTHIARESEKIRALKAEWDQWKMEMLNDEDWCATLVRYSGKGILILNNAYEIMKCFDDYIILRSSENTIQTKKDYQSGLFGWWRYNNWETDLQILTGAKAAMIENKCSAPRMVQKTSKIEEAMAVAERASEMAYQLMQQNPL